MKDKKHNLKRSGANRRIIPIGAHILIGLALLFLWGCGGSPENTPAETFSYSKLTLNWFPEVEHGGYFQAFAVNHPALQVSIEAGGPDIPVIQKVALGQSTFGIVNADDVINAQAQGADVVALFAPLNINPRCIMLHAEANITNMEQIQNMTLALSSRPAFSHWLRHRYPLKNVNIVPYPGSIATFVQNANFAQQAYNISEPFLAEQAGVKPTLIMVSDLGFNPYGSVLITQRKNLEANKDALRKIVQAAVKGWQDYLQNGSASHKIIHQLNPKMGLDILTYGHTEVKNLCVFPDSFGKMQTQRWQELIAQMEACGLIKKDSVQASQCFSNEFMDF